MARQKAKPPVAGDAFAFPLGDGRCSVCRVLVDTNGERSRRWAKQGEGRVILVACSRWVGDKVPRADDSRLRPILRLTHHAYESEPLILWLPEVLPPDMIPIGTIGPTAREEAMKCDSFSLWEIFLAEPLTQWRWDNGREAVLAEDAEQEKAAEARPRSQRRRERHPARMTLDALRGHQVFPGWIDYPSPKAVRASRKIMNDTVRELIQLGPHVSEKDRMAVLQRCIEAFNELDARLQFIETEEREDICQEFAAVVQACELSTHEHLADRWREW